jgi:hypothetical protein
MKTRQAVLIVLVGIAQSASAQDPLIPDGGFSIRPGPYRLKVREVLARAFEEGVTSRAIVLPSFEPEYAVGLRKTKEGVEAFVLKASSSIWDVEYLKSIEEGRAVLLDEEGNRIPPERLEQDEYYQELKTGRLVALTEALSDYASGKADLKRLTEQVEKATKP